jgi:predicted ATP-grasp superfamily ATP-dependent carboligase
MSSDRVPDPLREPESYAAALRDLERRHAIHLLLPVTEASALAILPARRDFSAVVPLPAREVFDRICDKAAVAEAAAAVGLQVPTSVRIESPNELSAQIASMTYPVVLKPIRSIAGEPGDRRKQTVGYANAEQQLREIAASLAPNAYPMLLQQRVDGPGVGVFVLMHKGGVIARFCHERIREKPPSGGVSVYRRSVPVNEELYEASISLLRRLEWDGAAMVEFKIDARTGAAYIMEINGRFWGSLQLAIDAGVDFPALLVAAALGGEPEPVLTYQTEVYSRWFWGDVDHTLLRLLKRDNDLALPADAPGRLTVVLHFLRAFGPGSRNEIARFSDPAPAFRETVNWLLRR